jgi:hypothetical protein
LAIRLNIGALAVAVTMSGVVFGCTSTAPTPRPDLAATTVGWLEGSGYVCSRSDSPSQSGTQWTCAQSTAAEANVSVTIDADEHAVTTVSALIQAPLSALDEEDWTALLDTSVLGPSPYADRQDLRAWLLDHRAVTEPTDVGGVRVTISSADATTSIHLSTE